MSEGGRDAGRRGPLPEGHPSEAQLRSLAASRSGGGGGRACSVGPAEGMQRGGGAVGASLLCLQTQRATSGTVARGRSHQLLTHRTVFLLVWQIASCRRVLLVIHLEPF